MRRSIAWGLLALLAGTASAAGGSASETEIGVVASAGMRVFAKVEGDKLVLRSLGPTASQVAYAVDLDNDGRIAEADLYYTVQKDGKLCTGPWFPARKVLECGRRSLATGSQETIGPQTIRRLEVPLAEVAPTARSLRMLLMISKPAGGKALAWLTYDLVTGEAKPLANPAAASPVSANAPGPAEKPSPAPATTAPAASCPPTTQALAQWLSGRRLLNRKKETPTVSSGGFVMFAQDGEDSYDTTGVTLLGARPLRMIAIIHEGKPRAIYAHFAGHGVGPFESAFRAEFGGRGGDLRCDPRECRWQLVEYPKKAPKGVLGSASISIYNLTRTETTLNCRYGE